MFEGRNLNDVISTRSGRGAIRFALLAAVAGMVLSSGPVLAQVVLFADNFNRADGTDLNASTAGKSGRLGALEWGSKTVGNFAVVDISNNQLHIASGEDAGARGGIAWIDHNFVEPASEFTVSIDIAAVSSGGNARYPGFGIGQTLPDILGMTGTQPGDGVADVYVAYDDIGATRGIAVFHGGVFQTNTLFTANRPDTLSATFTFSNMNAGSPLNYQVYLDGALIVSGSTVWSGTQENFITVQSNARNNTLFDNFSVASPLLTPSVSVDNLPATGITSTSAVLNASVEVAYTNADVYAHWWLPGGATNSVLVTSLDDVDATNVSYSIGGLSPVTVHEYTFQVTGAATDLWASPSESFTTLPTSTPPLVGLGGGATNMAFGTATLRGELTAGAAASAYICWGETDGGAASTSDWSNVIALGSVLEGNVFSNAVSGFLYGIEYDYRVYVTSPAGEAWSGVDSFATLLEPFSLWSPEDMSVQLWLDADDTNSLTLNGSAVAQWDDKSGNARHVAQTNVLEQPIYAGGVVSFNGVSSYLWNSSPFMYDNGQINAYIVGAVSPTADDRILSESSSSANIPLYCIAETHNGDYSQMCSFIRNDANSARFNHGALSASGAFDNGTKLYGWADTGSTLSGRVNGGVATSASYTRTGTLTLDRFSVGAILRAAAGAHAQASLGEIVITDNLSDPGRQRVEGYLAWKWGLEGDLPGAHPFSSFAPYNGMAVSVENSGATRLGVLDADVSGTLDADGSVFTVSVYWSTNDNADASGWTGDGSASSAVVGTYTNVMGQSLFSTLGPLSAGTTYYYTMVASNPFTNIWASANGSFTTLPPPTAPAAGLAGGATNPGVGTATLRGELVAGGSGHLFICWGEDDGGTTSTGSWQHASYLGEWGESDVQSVGVMGLYYGLEYDYRVYVTNTAGTAWSALGNFTTELGPDVRSITTRVGAGVSGQMDYDNGGAFGGGSWHVKNSGPTSGYTRKGYVRFDTTYFGKPVTEATMEIVISNFGLTTDRDVNVYGITEQSLDNVTLDNSLTWTTAPANDTSSAFAADLTKATLLGAFTVLRTDAVGTLKSFSSQALIDFINADTNGVITLILGRPARDGNNLMFAGDSNGTLDPPTLVVEMAPGAGLVFNRGATGIQYSEAGLHGELYVPDSVFSVYAYASRNNNTTATSWHNDTSASSVYVGTYTNVTSHPVTGMVSSLYADSNYFYTFMLSNVSTNIVATPNGRFTTEPVEGMFMIVR